jgi:hypothetical protein
MTPVLRLTHRSVFIVHLASSLQMARVKDCPARLARFGEYHGFKARGFCGAGLFQQGEKMANENEAYQAGLMFDRFRSRNEVPYLLILDCETRRFTIEQPGSTANFRQWCQEVDKAIASGRHLVCVPVNKQNTEEIEAMGAGLGYTLWPSRTIIWPANTGEADAKIDASDSEARKKEDDLRRRLLARVGLR